MDERMKKVQRAVERELVCSAHSMAHVWRVYRLCLKLAAEETNVDPADPRWNLLLSQLRTLSAIVNNSEQDSERSAPGPALAEPSSH